MLALEKPKKGISKDWRHSQSSQCSFIDDEINYIGFFENLNHHWQRIGPEIGIKKKLIKSNTSTHRNFRKYYSRELKELVIESFREDFQKFYPGELQ